MEVNGEGNPPSVGSTTPLENEKCAETPAETSETPTSVDKPETTAAEDKLQLEGMICILLCELFLAFE